MQANEAQAAARCRVANGTYCCGRPAGHAGAHESQSPLYSAGYRTGTRIARFADAYAEVRFATRRYPTK